MLYIFNQSEVFIDILSNESIDDPIISNDNFKRQVNGEWSYIFDVNITKLVEQNIKVKNKVGFYDENNNFQLFTIEKIEDNFGDKDIKSVLCYHDFYSLVNKIVENLELHNVTASNVLTQILQGTNYQIGNVMELGNRDFFITYESSLQALNSLLNAFGGEVGYRLTLNANKTGIGQRFVDIGRLGTDTGIRFSFDLNITGIKRTVETTNLFNVLYGRGKASDAEDEMGNRKITFADVTWSTPTNPTNKPLGQTYIEDAESITKWGRLEGVFQSDDTEDKEILLQRTFEKLQEMKNPMITYEVSIVDLAKITGFEHLKVQLGDTIFIYDADYDINLEARIIEESYSVFDPTAKEIVLGNFLKGYTDNNTTENLSSRLDILEDDIKNGVAVGYPDTLPTVPTVTANGLFSTVQLSWTYEGKVHYEYEIYASKILNFTPDPSNLIYRGKASAYLHEVLPKETWYYRVRAINTHGNYTAYSTQVTATTLKIADGTQYIEEEAIGHALIKDIDADKINVGKLKGQYIDAKDLTVTDGNDNKTLEVDSFGNVNIKANSIKLLVDNVEEGIATSSELTQSAEALELRFSKEAIRPNLIVNSNFPEKSTEGWRSFYLFDGYIYFESSPWVENQGIALYTYGSEIGVATNYQIPVKNNTTYTISAEALAEVNSWGGAIRVIQGNDSNWWLNSSELSFDSTEGAKKKSLTFTTGSDINKISILITNWGRRNINDPTYCVFFVKWVKLEEGDTATPWCLSNGEMKTDVIQFTGDGVKTKHLDGSYTKMSSNGLERFVSGTSKYYHYLSTLGEVFVNSEQTVEISLPEDYRNKNITVIASASQIGTGTDATTNTKPVISFYVDVVNVYNNPSGRSPYFRLYCSTRLRNTDGSVAYQDKGVLASWTAIS